MIDCLNEENTACVVNELPLIQDWSISQKKIDISSAITVFYNIAFDYSLQDSIPFDHTSFDSLALYLANDLNSMAMEQYHDDEYEIAINYCEIAQSFIRVTKQEHTVTNAKLLGNMGIIYDEIEKYDKAEICYLKALKLQYELLGENSQDYVRSLKNLGILYENIHEYEEAEKYYLKRLRIIRNMYGKQHLVYINALAALGAFYLDMDSTTKATPYYIESLDLIQPLKHKAKDDYASILHDMGLLYTKLEDYPKAEKYYLLALKAKKSLYGKKHRSYTSTLLSLATLYEQMSDTIKTENYFQEALRLRQKIDQGRDPSYAAALLNIAAYYTRRHNYTKAEDYYLQAIDVCIRISGEESLNHIYALEEIIAFYRTINNGTKQREYMRKKALAVMGYYGQESIEYAEELYQLSDACFEAGMYTYAEKHIKQAANIIYEELGENDTTYIKYIIAQGMAALKQGHTGDAEQCLLRADSIALRTWGEQSEQYAHCQNALAIYYMLTGSEEVAYRHIGTATHIYATIGQSNDLENMVARFNRTGDFNDPKDLEEILRTYYYHKRDYDFYHDIMDAIVNSRLMMANVMGGNSTHQFLYYCMLLGEINVHHQNPLNATQYVKIYAPIIKRNITSTINFMTEQQREAYWSEYKIALEEFIPRYAYRAAMLADTLTTMSYNNELFRKGFLLNSSELVLQSVLRSGDTALIRKWQDLAALKRTIVYLRENNASIAEISTKEIQAEQLEKDITKSSAAYRENMSIWQISWDSVRNHLVPGQVAIEFMTAPLNDDSTMYCAILLRDTSSYPLMIPLFEEKELKRLISRDPGETYSYYENGEDLSSLVWRHILPHIHAGETICFAPTGLLYQLAIEYLPYDAQHTMSDVFHFARLSSTREIAQHHTTPSYSTAILYGGIDYDTDTQTLTSESIKYPPINGSRTLEGIYRSHVDALPGTETETKQIHDLLQRAHINVKLYAASAANEESFKSLHGQRQNILHIATHGFFRTDSTAHQTDYFAQRTTNANKTSASSTMIDPLYRSGLLFAGANIALQGHSADLPEGVQDGILTAKEISLLDLRDADLVVLSACETGSGEITGDGVFGLQRAFKMAGAQTIIMSLWPVNDNATQLLMTTFYRNWITNKQTKRVAFHNAQNTVRAKYKDPIYWAAFILLD
ncbi:MAG: CHAT domain-containing protein [Paludibacteraceae bacterium]|nr:CHAT domain-containing protein [Paludibacteraceae bacterium]